MATTRIIVRTVRYETLTYEFGGALSEDEAVDRIQEGGDDPVFSKIHAEDLDVTMHEVIS